MDFAGEGVVIEKEFSNVRHVTKSGSGAREVVVRADKDLKGGEGGSPIREKLAREKVPRNVHFNEFRERTESIGKRAVELIVAEIELAEG